MNHLADIIRDASPLLVQSAGLLVILCALPLLVLAWWKRIYPHTPLVILLGIPCVLSLALLIQPALLPIIGLIDVFIPLAAILDLTTLPRKRAFAVERETTRVVSVQKSHQIGLHISNLS